MGIHYAFLLQSLILNHDPANFDIAVVEVSAGSYKQRASVFAPFYDKSNNVRELINLLSPFNSIIMNSITMRYNATLLPSLKSIITLNAIPEEEVNGGSLKGVLDTSAIPHSTILPESKIVRGEIRDLYNKMIQNFKNKNIAVILTYSPVFGRNSVQELPIIESIKQLAEENNVYFEWYQDRRYTTYSDCKLYMDKDHLNQNGASLLSNDLGLTILRVLK